jgi:hypothetical protein
VLHIIDADAPDYCLEQIKLLAGADDRFVSVGPAPAGWAGRTTALHRPMGSPALCGWANAGLAGDERAIHAWSIPAALAARHIARRRGCWVILSLAHLPQGADLEKASRLAEDGRTAFTVPTLSCQARLQSALPPMAHVHVLPPAAGQIDDAPTRRTAAREALGVDDDQHLLVAPAAMTSQGGHRHACWVHAVLHQFRPDLRLLLPTGGPYQANVRSFARAAGHINEVFFPDYPLSPADALAASDIAMFFSSRDGGLSGLAAAMAAGLPIIAWDSSDVRECTAGGAAAKLAPVGDVRGASSATLEVLEDADLRKALSTAASRHAAQNFPVSRARRKLQEIHANPAQSTLLDEPASKTV